MLGLLFTSIFKFIKNGQTPINTINDIWSVNVQIVRFFKFFGDDDLGMHLLDRCR